MSSVKRFVLNVFTDGELDEVVVGLSEINSFVTSIMQYPLVEDTQDELVDLYENEGEFETLEDE